jgi:hypothetical protein
MSSVRDPDRLIALWLEEGPRILPSSTRRAIVVTTSITPQTRRPWWAPWRHTPVTGSLRVAALVATVAVIAALGLGLGLVPGTRTPALLEAPTPRVTPASSPTALGTSSWKSYRSDRYGFSLGYPPSTRPIPATRDWSLAADRLDWQSTAAERFPAADGSLLVTAWSVPAAPATSLDDWLRAYCGGNTCQTLITQAKPIEFDGHPGKLIVVTNDSVQAFALVDGTIYAIAGWRDWAEPNVRAFASTLQIDPAPSASPDRSPD